MSRELNSGYPAWASEPPDISPESISGIDYADIVIIGGGHAGVQCALAAAEGGKKVIVVESQSQKNMTWLGEQLGHVNSKFLIEHGFGPYNEGEIVQEFCRLANYRINAQLIYLYVSRSGEMVDHLLSLLPPDSDMLDPDKCNVFQAYGNPEYPIVRGGHKSWAGTIQFRGGVVTDRDEKVPMMSLSRLKDLERMAMERSIELGTKWNFGQKGALLTQTAGRVTGVIAVNRDGSYFEYLANNAVVLAAGDFGQNGEMMSALLDEARDLSEVRGIDKVFAPGRDGSGHKMGIWAGGRMEASPRASMVNFALDPLGYTGLALNRDGRRFCNEGVPQGIVPAALRQPMGMIYGITDSKWLRQMQVCGLNHGAPDFGRPEYIEQCIEDMQKVAAAGKDGYEVRMGAYTERNRDRIYGANTLIKLADILEVPEAVRGAWLDSIDEYNRLCYSGEDKKFGKDSGMMLPVDEPPFYGRRKDSREMDFGLVSLSGLVTDDRMNVLGSDDEPIAGLYAIGNCLGGRYSLHYETPIAGNSIGMAMTHGRALGQLLSGQNSIYRK